MKKLIGLTGFARSGKDTFFERSKMLLEKEDKACHRVAFADALKHELDDVLIKYTGISAFTEDNKSKELIRPLLVTYGTHIRRHLNQNCWIERVQPSVIHNLSAGKYVFITDVRFENEAQWISNNGGILINVAREGVRPANHEERAESIKMKKYIKYNVDWPTFGSEELDSCDEYVIPILAHIVQSQPKFEEVM